MNNEVTVYKNRFYSNLFISVFICSALIALSSCFTEKNIAPPSNQNVGTTEVIEMGPAYSDQFFYNLETNTVVSQNSRFAYDLMFDCDATKFNVWLNTAKSMSLVRTTKTELQNVTIADTAGLKWHYELGSFNVDSNAFGAWWNNLSSQPTSAGAVYIIFLGKDAEGESLGYAKMKVNDFTGSSYSITFAGIADTVSSTALIQKDASRNYAYFDLINSKNVADIEPNKLNWDLCFTRYSIIFYQPFYLPYEVTGVLHNPGKVQAYLDSTLLYDSVTINTFNTSKLSTDRDAIGYTWKLINDPQGQAQYSIKFNFVYLIKAGEDKYYKLRFYDFYRNTVKGYPAFEYYRL